jgi:tetratricopeptide (TPR) repeat protein
MGRTFLNRYYAASNRGDAASNLSSALAEFGYLVEHWYPEYPAADIYLHRGIVLSLMKKNAEAIIDLTKALSYDSRSVRAYITLSDLFDNMKQRAKALEVVTEGLRYVPESKILKRRYEELGGKLPYPEPIAVQPKPEISADNPKPKETDSGANAANPQAQTSNTSAQESAAGKITDKETSTEGAPPKRWCRFCAE